MVNELWPNRFRPTPGPLALLRVPKMCDSLSRRLSAKDFLLLGSVSVDGFRATNLSRQSAKRAYRTGVTVAKEIELQDGLENWHTDGA